MSLLPEAGGQTAVLDAQDTEQSKATTEVVRRPPCFAGSPRPGSGLVGS
jgi:hypothetical protein